MATDWTTTSPGTGSHADVNGLHLYYEIHGTGRPTVVLHGGLGSGEMFGPLIPELTAAGRQVIAPDLQGHGRTADIDRPLSLEAMADDIAALIRDLGLDQVDIVGYSLGGGVALHTALRHPALVRRLAVTSIYVRDEAIYPELRAQQGQVSAAAAEFMKDTPMWELYQRVAPRPEDFGRLLDKIGAYMMKPFDWMDDLRGLPVPTLISGADADQVPPSHFVEMFAALGGGQRDGGWDRSGRPEGGHALAIIPGTTHYDIFSSPLLARTWLAFLES